MKFNIYIKQILLKIFIKIIFLYSVLFSIHSCFTEVGNPEPEYSISGTATKGPISNGIVTAYSLKADGTLGVKIDSTTTNENGEFSFLYSESFKNPVAFILTEGLFKDEATSNNVYFEKEENLRTYLPSISTEQEISITALTEIATSCSLTKVQSGLSINNALEYAYNDIAQKFGLSNITMTPENPFKGNLDATKQESKYALIQAGFSEYAKINGAKNTISVVKAFALDNEDCTFDGKSFSNTIILEGTNNNFAADAYQKGLKEAIDSYISSSQNTTGIKAYPGNGNKNSYGY
ncbi:MAG: hypothetical protein OEZ22_08920 [Spirochaetia bacterium]|nr:hypothetical protein [Spirochaetia bacterium]